MSIKEQYDEKVALLSAKRNKRAIELLREIITAPDFFEERGENIPNFLAIIDAFVTIYGFKPKTYSNKVKGDLKEALNLARTDRQKLYWESVAGHIEKELNITLRTNLRNIKTQYEQDICEILGISWSNLFLKATLEVKEPKVLEKLKQQIEEENK